MQMVKKVLCAANAEDSASCKKKEIKSEIKKGERRREKEKERGKRWEVPFIIKTERLNAISNSNK